MRPPFDSSDLSFDDYIKSKNLSIDTVEKIVSFFRDKEYCREDWWFKRSVVQHVYGEKFSEVWPLVIEALENQYQQSPANDGPTWPIEIDV